MTLITPHRRFLATLALAACSIQLASAQTQSPASAQPSQPPRKVVHVLAERFAFTPSEIIVEEGTLLEIQLRSDDTNHGFRIKGTSTNVVIPKSGRGAMSVTFDAIDARPLRLRVLEDVRRRPLHDERRDRRHTTPGAGSTGSRGAGSTLT